MSDPQALSREKGEDGVLVLTGSGDGWTLTLPSLSASRRRDSAACRPGLLVVGSLTRRFCVACSASAAA